MYVFGGCDGSNCFSDLFEFRFDSRTWSIVEVSSCPTHRYFHEMVAYKNNIFVIGGKDLFRLHEDIHEFRVSVETPNTPLSSSISPRNFRFNSITLSPSTTKVNPCFFFVLLLIYIY